MPVEFDIAFFADPGFQGGSSRAVAAEVAALAQAGRVAGWCPVQSPVFPGPRPVQADLAAHLAAGHLIPVDPRRPARVRLALVHHPQLFTHLPPEPLGLSPDRVLLVLHHPPRDGLGRANYDLPGIIANLAETFAAPVTLAPVSAVVRAQLSGADVTGADVLAEDWVNLIDLAHWPASPARSAPAFTIGRHSRPQASKFPDTLAQALLAYPEAPGIIVRMLGCPDLVARYGRLPENWQPLPFGAEPVAEFLRGLDLYVYAHGREWVEAFGYSVLEAIAAGVPVIATPAVAASFGPAVIAAELADMPALIEALRHDPERRAGQAAQARSRIAARFGIDQFLPRLERLFPAAAACVPPPAPPPPKVVMVSSNGVGLGHLTRLLAIAGALPEGSEVSFFTLSQGYRLVAEAGYPVQFVPHYRSTGAEPDPWNAALAEELSDFLDLTRPDILVFDGNVPYPGLLAALDRRPDLRRVWVRRGLWGPRNQTLGPPGAFDLIVEPSELSARFDAGATAGDVSATGVAPILLCPPAGWLTRDAARAALGLDPDGLAVGLMLGSGSNFDLTGIRRAVLADLARRGVQVVEFTSPLADVPGSGGPDENHHRRDLYPAAPHFSAFDFMVAGAGYNSFHEAMLGAVPTILIPNEAGEMDLQILRARHAHAIGCAELLRSTDRIGLRDMFDRMCDPAHRARMRARMRRLPQATGAADAAARIVALQPLLRLRQGF